MPFPTDALLVALTSGLVGGASGGLGGVWLKSHFDLKQARLATVETRAGRQRDAYASLAVTARLALRNDKQLAILYARQGQLPDDSIIRSILARTDTLADELSQAAAVVELTGSEDARKHAAAVYDAAKSAAELYQARSHRLASGKWSGFVAAIGDVFDSAEARKRCEALADAIEAFIGAVRGEFS
jgi:hypothetical protein